VKREKIKILHVTFNMGIGGTERVILQLINGLDSDCYECSILCIDGEIGSIGNSLQEKGIQIISYNRKDGFDASLILYLHRLIKQQQFNVLHCHQYTPYFYGALSSIFTKCKVIFTEHGRFYPDRYSWKRRIINQILYLTTDSITTISKATKDALIRYEWMPKKAISVIYNGIEPAQCSSQTYELKKELRINEEDLLLGTISRLDPVKNQKMMIDAFYEVNKAKANTKLLIVGDGPSRERLEKHAIKLKLDNSVIFTGFQTSPDEYLALMDVFLLSSFTEGTSISLLEAMSLGKPSVLTDVGGNSEVIDNGTHGFLTQSNDVLQFSDKILTLLMDNNLRAKLGDNSKVRFLNTFGIKIMIDTYQQLYQKLANDTSGYHH